MNTNTNTITRNFVMSACVESWLDGMGVNTSFVIQACDSYLGEQKLIASEDTGTKCQKKENRALSTVTATYAGELNKIARFIEWACKDTGTVDKYLKRGKKLGFSPELVSQGLVDAVSGEVLSWLLNDAWQTEAAKAAAKARAEAEAAAVKAAADAAAKADKAAADKAAADKAAAKAAAKADKAAK